MRMCDRVDGGVRIVYALEFYLVCRTVPSKFQTNDTKGNSLVHVGGLVQLVCIE